jgi:Uri superfamily endonuclease
MAKPTENRALYEQGRKYVRRVNKRRATTSDLVADLAHEGRKGVKVPDPVADIAHEDGEGVKVVRYAYNFAINVDAIAAVARGARKAILDGNNPHLTPNIIAEIAKKPPSAGKIRRAMANAAAGHHPLVREIPDNLSQACAASHIDLEQLLEASTFLQRIEKAIAYRRLRRRDVLDDLAKHVTAIRVCSDAMRLVLDRGTSESVATPATSPRGERTGVVKIAKDARKRVEAVTGDLLRSAHSQPPLGELRDALSQAVETVASSAERILVELPSTTRRMPAPKVKFTPGGPYYDIGGTYVVIFHAEKKDLVRFGALGTFWVPNGYLLYVGSGFNSGGVAARTAWHIQGTGPRIWNVDDLRGFADPVEVWWTHHQTKVECTWAMTLASMPECCCPAPQAGARDCKRCPTHLYWTKDRLTIDAFAEQLGLLGSGGYELHWQTAAQAIARADRKKPSPPRKGEIDQFNLFS